MTALPALANLRVNEMAACKYEWDKRWSSPACGRFCHPSHVNSCPRHHVQVEKVNKFTNKLVEEMRSSLRNLNSKAEKETAPVKQDELLQARASALTTRSYPALREHVSLMIDPMPNEVASN